MAPTIASTVVKRPAAEVFASLSGTGLVSSPPN